LLKEGAREVVIIDNLFIGSEDSLSSALTTGRAVFIATMPSCRQAAIQTSWRNLSDTRLRPLEDDIKK
jgi:hypothetical protein